MSSLELVSVGGRAVLVELADADQALDLAQWVRGRLAADEVVPAACTVLLDGVDPREAREVLAGWQPGRTAYAGELVEVPVVYDGPDLDAVARLVGLSADEVVATHSEIEHVVAFCGFAPGFAYLTGSPWEVPRLDSPRPRVEAGSIGLAGALTGTYPSASPGGWQLIGRTDAVLWDATRDDPALLPPGTRVRFVPA